MIILPHARAKKKIKGLKFHAIIGCVQVTSWQWRGYLFEHLMSASSPHEPWPLHNGTILCICALVVCDSQWMTAASHSAFGISIKVVTALFSCYMAGATWNCCRLDASSMYTIQPCSSLQCHFIWSHIGRIRVCLALTCYLHFWQNDGDFSFYCRNTRMDG